MYTLVVVTDNNSEESLDVNAVVDTEAIATAEDLLKLRDDITEAKLYKTISVWNRKLVRSQEGLQTRTTNA